VSVAELQRAWQAVQSGQFRRAVQGDTPATHFLREPTAPSWTLARDEHVLPVVRCASAYGATTLALALATAADTEARVVACSSGSTSGLAAASTAELGTHPSGWMQGTRGDVLLQRADHALASVHDIPPPMPGTKTTLTILDVGWELGQVLNTASWLAGQLKNAAAGVVVTCAMVPGFRHLEGALALLQGSPTVVAVIGPPLKRWPKPVHNSAGSLTRPVSKPSPPVCYPGLPPAARTGLPPASNDELNELRAPIQGHLQFYCARMSRTNFGAWVLDPFLR
jgi:hypothetical protein